MEILLNLLDGFMESYVSIVNIDMYQPRIGD